MFDQGRPPVRVVQRSCDAVFVWTKGLLRALKQREQVPSGASSDAVGIASANNGMAFMEFVMRGKFGRVWGSGRVP